MCGSSPFQGFAGLGFKDMSGSSGICHQRSEISIAEITDGTASTYLVGEKNVAIADYSTGLDPGDDQCYLSGDDLDLQRWTAAPPLADQPDEHHDFAFGVFTRADLTWFTLTPQYTTCRLILTQSFTA